ncbi:PCDG1 protein, partial [Columbina picui]|nr:PCDG1 protein [Columbina picui]
RWERALLWGVLVVAWETAWGQLHYSIPEEMPKGSFVGNVATDLGLQLPALGDSGVRILDKGRKQYFALYGKTGHLVTAERIDREQLCESVQQCVLRCEMIVKGEIKIYGVEVKITDINDNDPSFREAEKELRLSETTAPGSRFPLPGAHDPDSGQNSVQSYELSGDEHFSLAVQTGPGGDQRPELVLVKTLDREAAAFHELVLRASDGGEPARTGTARIRVAVLDANDNAPVFSQAEYTVRVPEDVPVGSTLVTVTATDPDEGLNGHSKFSLQKVSIKASQIFHLDPETGAITLVRSLDFEEGDSYEMEVQAEDGGGLSDTAKFVITVTDVNDNAPQISVQSALTEISEDAPSGTVSTPPGVRFPLGSGRDPDIGTNSIQNYQLTPNSFFSLVVRESPDGTKQPELVLEKSLDREKQRNHNLILTAVDGGDPVRSGTAQIKISVTDANDNTPIFTKEVYKVQMLENLPEGSLAFQVKATDSDEGTNADITYSFSDISNRARQLFTLDSRTGDVKIKGSLDYEEGKHYEAMVEGKDGGGLSAHAKVHIDIIDVNDNAPTL